MVVAKIGASNNCTNSFLRDNGKLKQDRECQDNTQILHSSKATTLYTKCVLNMKLSPQAEVPGQATKAPSQNDYGVCLSLFVQYPGVVAFQVLFVGLPQFHGIQ